MSSATLKSLRKSSCDTAITNPSTHPAATRSVSSMNINDRFDGIMKSINQFADAIAEQRSQEKMQESGRGPENGDRNSENSALRHPFKRNATIFVPFAVLIDDGITVVTVNLQFALIEPNEFLEQVKARAAREIESTEKDRLIRQKI